MLTVGTVQHEQVLGHARLDSWVSGHTYAEIKTPRPTC